MQLPMLTVRTPGSKYYEDMTVEEVVSSKLHPYDDNTKIAVIGECVHKDKANPEADPFLNPNDRDNYNHMCRLFEPAADTFKSKHHCFFCLYWKGIAWENASILLDYLNEPENQELKNTVYNIKGTSCPFSKKVLERFNDLDFRDFDY